MNRRWWPYVTLFLVALGVRVAVAGMRAAAPIVSDELLYHELGYNLLRYHAFVFDELPGQPTAMMLPLYPTVIAAIYALAGPSWFAVRLVQAIIGAGTAVVMALTATCMAGERTGRWAGWLLACHPMFIIMSTLLLTETVFVGLLALTLYSCMRLTTTWSRGWSGALGVSAGLLALCRAEGAGLPFWWLGMACVRRESRRRAVSALLIALCVMAACVTPWALRNYRLLGRLVPLSTLGGLNTWEGVTGRPFEYAQAPPEHDALNYLYLESRDASLYRESIAAFWAHPGHTLRLMAQRAVMLYVTPYGLNVIGEALPVKATAMRAARSWRSPYAVWMALQPLLAEPVLWWRILLYVVQWALLGCAVAGGWALRRMPQMHWILGGLVYFTLVYAVMPAVPRYNVALILLCVPLAAHGVCRLAPARSS